MNKLGAPQNMTCHTGRVKGSKNKFTSLKDDFLQAYQKMGGMPTLAKWGAMNQSKFYELLARLLPQEQKHAGGIDINVTYRDKSDEELIKDGIARGINLPERIARMLNIDAKSTSN